MHGSLDHGLLYIGGLKRLSGRQPAVKCFVQIDDHHHPGIDCDAEQGYVADSHGNAEVVTEPPLQQQPPSRRIDGRKDQNNASPTEWKTI